MKLFSDTASQRTKNSRRQQFTWEENSAKSTKKNFKFISSAVFDFYHNLLEVQIFTPLLYAIVLIISFFQQLHFIFSNLNFQKSILEEEGQSFEMVLKYLPLYPAIIETGSSITYFFIFGLLLIPLVFYHILLALSFWIGISSENQTQVASIIKLQMNNSFKIVLKVASLYVIIQRELLTIPSLQFSFDLLKCKTLSTSESKVSSISSQNGTAILHQGTNLECWSSLYITLVAFGVFNLILLMIFHIFQILYMNDIFQESKLPWAQATSKPIFLNLMINIGYTLSAIIDDTHKYKIIMDIFCLLLTAITLIFRFLQPTFQYEFIQQITIGIEVSRLWSCLIVIFHSFLGSMENPITIILQIIIDICLIIIFLKLIEYRENKVVLNGIKKIKSSNDLNIYLTQMYKMIEIDQKKTSIPLQGILQTHIHTCSDLECPCDSANDYIHSSESNHQFRLFDLDSKKLPVSQLFNMDMTQTNKKAQIFMERFQLRKATDIDQLKKRYKSVSPQESGDESEHSVHKHFGILRWYQFINYYIKKRTAEIKIDIDFHYFLSTFYFMKIKNEFQSLFELIVAQEKHPSQIQKFLIYRLEKRIEKVIFQKHEKQASMSRKLNILSVYEYEKNFSQFQRLILKNTSLGKKFWCELLEKDINVRRMHEIGINISENHQEITKVANKLLVIYPNQLVMLLIYSKYLCDVINNEFSALDFFSLALQQRLNLRQKQRLLHNNDNEDQLFGENSFCAIFVLQTENRNLGIVEYVNDEVFNLLGYHPHELIGQDINTVIPRIIAKSHRQLLMKFFEKAESTVLNIVRELFGKDKEGYLVPIYLFSKVLPSLSGGLKLIGVMRKVEQLTFQPECPNEFIKMPQEYILCDSENNVQNFTYGMTPSFGIFPKMFQSTSGNSLFDQEVQIEYFSTDILDKEEELKSIGSVVTINTSRLFEKVDREVLSNEEFKFFMQQSGQIRVFCQMTEINFSNLVTIKLIRIIHYSKHQTSNSRIQSISLSSQMMENNNFSQPGGNASQFFNFASQSSTSSGSTILSVDNQLKDFKKKITENTEPYTLKMIKRVMIFLLLFITLTSSLAFYCHLNEVGEQFHYLDHSHYHIKMIDKLIMLQNNIRSLLLVANNIETGYQKINPLPYSNRYQYLLDVNYEHLEQVRNLNDLLTNQDRSDDQITIYEINMNGKPYEYQMNYQLAASQYVVKALDLMQEDMSQLKMPVLNWTNGGNSSTFKNLNAFVSAYFIINTGFKQLNKIFADEMELAVADVISFESTYAPSVRWLSAVSCIVIFICYGLLVFVIQLVEKDKVGVLSLYSEIKIGDAKQSLSKCQRLYHHLRNVKKQTNLAFEDYNVVEDDFGVHEGSLQMSTFSKNRSNYFEDFDKQWERFVERLEYFRVNQQKIEIERLKKQLNHDSGVDVSVLVQTKKQEEPPKQEPQTLDQMTQNIKDAYQVHSPAKSPLKKSPSKKRSTYRSNRESVLNIRQRGIIKEKEQQKQISEIGLHKKQDDSEESSSNSEHSDESGDEQERRKRKRKKRKELNEVSLQLEAMTSDDNKIGKKDQFAKIKSRNWTKVLLILGLALSLLVYFFFAIFYQNAIDAQLRETAFHLKSSYYRSIQMNKLFGYFRERLLTQDDFYFSYEEEALSNFYENEKVLQDAYNDHHKYLGFLYDFQSKMDSSVFCDYGSDDDQDNSLCQDFRDGLLKQGQKSAFFTFINYYTQASIQAQKSNKNHTQDIQIINSIEIQSYIVASETFLLQIQKKMDLLWEDNLLQILNNTKEIVKIVFIVFVILFLISQIVITPKIIQAINNDQWRSKGILNLVPNNIFKEMKQNSGVMKLLKS